MMRKNGVEKSITELYTKPSNTYTFESIECALDGKSFECKFKDKYQVNSESVKQVLDRFKRQSKTYINIFRGRTRYRFSKFQLYQTG